MGDDGIDLVLEIQKNVHAIRIIDDRFPLTGCSYRGCIVIQWQLIKHDSYRLLDVLEEERWITIPLENPLDISSYLCCFDEK